MLDGHTLPPLDSFLPSLLLTSPHWHGMALTLALALWHHWHDALTHSSSLDLSHRTRNHNHNHARILILSPPLYFRTHSLAHSPSQWVVSLCVHSPLLLSLPFSPHLFFFSSDFSVFSSFPRSRSSFSLFLLPLVFAAHSCTRTRTVFPTIHTLSYSPPLESKPYVSDANPPRYQPRRRSTPTPAPAPVRYTPPHPASCGSTYSLSSRSLSSSSTGRKCGRRRDDIDTSAAAPTRPLPPLYRSWITSSRLAIAQPRGRIQRQS